MIRPSGRKIRVAAALAVIIAGVIGVRSYLKRANGENAIQVASLRVTAGGYMVDLRYKIADPGLARAVLDRKTVPYLQHEKTGAKLRVPGTPKLGPLRQIGGTPNKDRSYFMLFANAGRIVKPGDRVDLHIGDRRWNGLQVQ